jgi:hypothetical protein
MTTTIMNTNPLPEPTDEFNMVLRLTEELGESESKIMRLEEEITQLRLKMIEQVQINYIYRKCGNWICDDSAYDIFDFTDDFVDYLRNLDYGEWSLNEYELAIDMYYKNQLRPRDCHWEKDGNNIIEKIREFYEEMIEDNDIDIDEYDGNDEECGVPHNFYYYHLVCENGENWYSYIDELHEVIDWAIPLPMGNGFYIQYS